MKFVIIGIGSEIRSSFFHQILSRKFSMDSDVRVTE